VVETAFAHLGGGTQFINADRVVAALKEQPRCGRHDAIAGIRAAWHGASLLGS